MVLKLTEITKSYPGADGPVQVLRGIDLSVSQGETLALTGESGSGKSTVLHIAATLEQPDTGRIWLDGEDVTQQSDSARARLRGEKIGVIFQQFNLIPSLTVSANIAFQARQAGRYKKAYAERLADQLGLREHLTKFPEALSGGQQQRVAIARALTVKPALILADEPTGNLDEATADTVLTQMLDLVAETNAALIVVTHSRTVAARMSRHAHLSGGLLA